MIPLRTQPPGELFESAPNVDPRFNGSDYEKASDKERLTGQILRVYECMKDGKFRTLDEIAGETGDPHASISAQLRHLRKMRFGSHTVNKQARGDREAGLFEYQLIVNRNRVNL